ncbi:MAG: patatin-like phospholipase family protein [Cyanobacteria bacterium P01_E01_bin.42]
MSNSNFKILSCDGGGIRGLITASILQELDKELHFLDQIDLFVGTSTGGLIALGLASDVSISTLVNLYGDSSNCSQIFTPYHPPHSSLLSDQLVDSYLKEIDGIERSPEIEKILKDLDKFLYVKYNNTGLKTVLKNTIPHSSQTLKCLRKKVLVTTFQLYNASDSKNHSWKPITLDNLPKNPIHSEKTKILDAALCTSAAPIYLPPYEHPDYGLCVDGGVFANNPSTLALARVIDSGILGTGNIQNIKLLSIGTGETQDSLPPSYQPHGPLRYGLTTWLWPFAVDPTPKFPLLAMLMDSSAAIDNLQANMFLGNEKYRRMNVELTEPIDAFGCSGIDAMKKLVSQYTHSPVWNEDTTWIKQHYLK